MQYYPLFLDVRGKKCVVVGGGGVGARKAGTLARAGGVVTVVSLHFSRRLNTLAETLPITLTQKSYDPSDLTSAFIVIAATDSRTLNRRVREDARRDNILCNIIDQPETSDFLVPAVVNQGDLSIAVSTTGKSPALAKHLRKELAKTFGPEYARFLVLMGNLRQALLHEDHNPEGHKTIFRELIHRGVIELIRDGGHDQIDSILYEVTGKAYRVEDLMAGFSDKTNTDHT